MCPLCIIVIVSKANIDFFHFGAKNFLYFTVKDEHSRIKLLDYKEPSNDYINANYIPSSMFPHTHTNYIATQGPKDSTIADFWYMILQQNASLIVMLCNELECGRPKCAQYWPKLSESYQFENNHVTLGGKLTVTTIKDEFVPNCNEKIIHRQIQLSTSSTNSTTSDDETTTRTTIVDQLQYVEWPDHGVPDQTKNFRLLCEQCDDLRTLKTKDAPVVVHCSAGIGRTGTFMTVCILTEQMRHHLAVKNGSDEAENGDDVDQPFVFEIKETVMKLKSLRRGMVQTMGQYQYAYEAILEEAESLGFNFSTMRKNQSCSLM